MLDRRVAHQLCDLHTILLLCASFLLLTVTGPSLGHLAGRPQAHQELRHKGHWTYRSRSTLAPPQVGPHRSQPLRSATTGDGSEFAATGFDH